ncbi:MAG: hypothetical protein AAB885_00315, partial [Patescibacteria group bacterium]
LSPICPLARQQSVCKLDLFKDGDTDGIYDLAATCRGLFTPCALESNNQPVSQFTGFWRALLSAKSGEAFVYNLKDNKGEICDREIVHGPPRAGLTPLSITVTGPLTLNQSGYRWFNNANSADVGSALAAINSQGEVSSGTLVRLRLLIHVGNQALSASGKQFKLQYKNCISANYADIGGDVSFTNNAAPADGDTLTANANDPTHSSDGVVNQTYEEANNFTNSVAAIPAGQDGMWDFALTPTFVEG